MVAVPLVRIGGGWGELKGKKWEEKKVDDGTKWKFLEHLGPLMSPDYEPLPPMVRF